MDIVERLRFRNKAAELGDNLCADAADEIERLRKENDRLRSVINARSYQSLSSFFG